VSSHTVDISCLQNLLLQVPLGSLVHCDKSCLFIYLVDVFQSLMDGLKEVDSDLWRDVVDLQAHWIGNCDGVRFEFQILVCRILLVAACC